MHIQIVTTQSERSATLRWTVTTFSSAPRSQCRACLCRLEQAPAAAAAKSRKARRDVSDAAHGKVEPPRHLRVVHPTVGPADHTMPRRSGGRPRPPPSRRHPRSHPRAAREQGLVPALEQRSLRVSAAWPPVVVGARCRHTESTLPGFL